MDAYIESLGADGVYDYSHKSGPNALGYTYGYPDEIIYCVAALLLLALLVLAIGASIMLYEACPYPSRSYPPQV